MTERTAYLKWFFRQLHLRVLYALRDPWDVNGNKALLREIDGE